MLKGVKYLVVRCPRCGMLSAVRLGSSRHQCPYCGLVFTVDESTIVAKANNGREAREIILRLSASPGKHVKRL